MLNKLISLNLRHKFHLGLTLFLLVVSLVGALSYMDLARIGSRVELLNRYEQLNNVILEARRFEKNYLLYGNSSDLQEARTYVNKARQNISILMEEYERVKEVSQFKTLRLAIDDYCSSLQDISDSSPATRAQDTENLRYAGKSIVELAEEMARKEHHDIRSILAILKTQLVIAVGVAAVLGVLGVYVLFWRMFNALETIHKATQSIGQGRFEPLPEKHMQKETKRIVHAFNHMLSELERRQEQLVQAQKLSSIGTLSAGIAHQLNNPLNNISTSCQIVQEEFADGKTDMLEKMLLNIENESSRAKEIVQGLLEFSREHSFQPRQASLYSVVNKTIRLVSSQVPAGVEIHQDVPQYLTLSLDVQRIQEALLNLFINALQAMPSDYGYIHVFASLDESGNKVVITVSDSGTGIPKEVAQRIFDPFFTTKDERSGTGLGLAIVYGIVEKHGGTIEVHSEEGKGTTFTITLPYHA